MRVPLSWINEFAQIPSSLSPEEISDAFVRIGFEVEEIELLGEGLKGPVVVGVVKQIDEITEFKKAIRWVELDCGEGESRFVICGATNFAIEDLVVVALPGAVLPGDFVISQRETYGKISNGMICSSRELGLGQDHDGILVLPKGSATPGDDALALLETHDIVFDIAVNPDRGYALSVRGMAREIAAALGTKFTDPASLVDTANFPLSNEGVSVSIDDPTATSVIYVRSLAGFDQGATTPLWMSRKIEKCGMRSISLAVDITNFVMLELGQPLHAFDSDKIRGSLHIRRAGKTRTLKTLDGQMRTLSAEDLVVSDDERPLALAGTMGGEESEVDGQTTAMSIEAARFDPISVARNSKSHRIPSEASKRFERGVDHALAEVASARALELMIRLGGAHHVGTHMSGKVTALPSVEFDPNFASVLTGAVISPETVQEKLEVVGCTVVKVNDSQWTISPPTWRSDLQSPSDLVEEVARMIGYQAIPSLLPPRQVSPGLTASQSRQRAISTFLADRGLVEIQTYPFVSAETMQLMGFSGTRSRALKIANPMSEDAPLLRTHLIPGLLEAATRNVGRGAKDFALFEIGSIFRFGELNEEVIVPGVACRPSEKEIAGIYASVPEQPIHLGAVFVGNSEREGWQGKARSYDWNDAIALVTSILDTCKIEWTIKSSDFAPWHPGRCAEILVAGKVVAHAGELHPRVVAAYGLPARACAAVLNMSSLPERTLVRAKFLGTMPIAVQDIALIVDEHISARRVENALREGAGELLESIRLFDRYDQIGEGKVSLAFTLTFRAPDRTLTAAEVSQMRESAAKLAFEATGAIVRTA
ncbi:MAG: phenylalanine--tRNA ligase subunit beta [Actinobacteria bacterium]|nr:phenylalanine--tRNA ligase subunit beta [Actinomycetota bacterium]